MRVAIVTHDVGPEDGQARVCMELARYLVSKGHEVHLFSIHVQPGLLQLPRLVWHRVSVRITRPDLVRCVVFMAKATAMLRAHRFDIIHLNGAVALVRHHVNSAHFVHRTWVAGGFSEVPGWRGAYHRLYRLYNAWLEGVVFRQAQRVVGVSPKAADEVRRFFGLPNRAVTSVLNGCDAPLPALSASERDQVRRGLWPELAGHEMLIAFAGDIRTSRKGIDTLLRAMVRLREHPIRLVVAGSTMASPYPAMAAALGLDDRVRFLGFRRDLSRIFQAADGFVFPTRYETFGLVVTEAASAGCPLLISAPRYCGAADLFRNDESALFLTDPAADEELAEKLQRLLEEPERRQHLGKQARNAVAGWTWDHMGRAYEAVYRDVLSE